MERVFSLGYCSEALWRGQCEELVAGTWRNKEEAINFREDEEVVGLSKHKCDHCQLLELKVNDTFMP